MSKPTRTQIFGIKEREQIVVECVENAKFSWMKANDMLKLHDIHIHTTRLRGIYERIKNGVEQGLDELKGQKRVQFVEIAFTHNFDQHKIQKDLLELFGEKKSTKFIDHNFQVLVGYMLRFINKGFIKKKKFYFPKNVNKGKCQYSTISVMYSHFRHLKSSDEELNTMHQGAEIMEKYIRLYVRENWADRTQFYGEFSKITNRREATLFMECFFYLENILKLKRKIQNNVYTPCNMFNHEDLESNRLRPTYKYLVEQTDRYKVFQRYHQHQLEQPQKYHVKISEEFGLETKKRKSLADQDQFSLREKRKDIETKNGFILNKKLDNATQGQSTHTQEFDADHFRMLEDLEQEKEDDIEFQQMLFYQEDQECETMLKGNSKLNQYFDRRVKQAVLKEKLLQQSA